MAERHTTDGSAVVAGAPAWSELLGSRFAAPDRLGLAEATEGLLGDPERRAGEEVSSADGEGSRPETPGLGRRRWLFVAPLAGALALAGVSAAFDPNPLRTGTSRAGLLAFAVLVPFFWLSVAGTVALVRDASRVRAAAVDWSPNPWRYLAASAAVLALLRAYPAVRSAGSFDGAVGYLAGTFVVALAAASILAGPAYLLQRRRRLGST